MSSLLLEAERLVTQLTGRRPEAITQINRGVMTHKFLAVTRDGDFVVRFYPTGRETVGDIEPALLRRCRSAGLLVPEVMEAARGDHGRYSIYRYVQGVTLGEAGGAFDAAAYARLARDIDDQLTLLGNLVIENFGELVSPERCEHLSMERFVEATASAALGARDLPSPLGRVAYRMLDWAGARRPRKTAQLIWGDISPENIIVTETGRLVALIDFEGAIAAHHAATLGFLQARYPDDRLTRSLLDAAASETTLRQSAIDTYTVFRALRLWPYLAQPLPTGRPRDPIETVLPGLAPALERLLLGEIDFDEH